jgi:hypothetical protein
MPPPYDLKDDDAREIFERHRDAQIMAGESDVENAHLLVGFASRCWTEAGIFDTEKAMRAANELCHYLRMARQESASGSWTPEPDYAAAMRIMDRTLRQSEAVALLTDPLPVVRAMKVRA